MTAAVTALWVVVFIPTCIGFCRYVSASSAPQLPGWLTASSDTDRALRALRTAGRSSLRRACKPCRANTSTSSRRRKGVRRSGKRRSKLRRERRSRYCIPDRSYVRLCNHISPVSTGRWQVKSSLSLSAESARKWGYSQHSLILRHCPQEGLNLTQRVCAHASWSVITLDGPSLLSPP